MPGLVRNKGSQPPSDDELSDDECEWTLGFVEEPERSTDLLRHRFPSKVGGRPAWLHPAKLPTPDQIKCKVTGKQLQFLMQVYAPLDDKPDAFHRTVFIFISPQGDKLAEPGAVRAFRCQLPRRNPYYSHEPPKPSDKAPPPLSEADALAASSRDPWGAAEAEQQVAAGRRPPPAPAGMHLWPEQELLHEPEPEDDDGTASSNSGTGASDVQRALRDYEARIAAEGAYSEEELPEELIDSVEREAGEERKHFAMFQARVARAPEQCLRYCYDSRAKPLWPKPSGQPSAADIPACPHCSAPRKFEMQVMPQLLSFMEVNDEDPAAADWSTLAIYSCSNSCTPDSSSDSAYLEEFVWVQGP